MMDELHSRWDYLCGKIWADNRDEVFNTLDAHYSQQERHYHNWDHILHCLRELDDIGNVVMIELAIWYHDVIYDPRQNDNENKSAKFFLKSCRKLKPHIYRPKGDVTKLIRSTKNHNTARLPFKRKMLDIDLSILGASAEDFNTYSEKIRAEYYWVPIDIFNKKRLELLTKFIKRKRIYQTEHFWKKYENQARKNIWRHIVSLSFSPKSEPYK